MQGVDWRSLPSKFEVQLDPIRTSRAHLRDFLPYLDLLPLLHQQPAVVTVGANVGIAMFDDQQFAIAAKATTGVNDSPIRRSQNRLAQFPSQINSFIQTAV